ncbi:hypothetical protein [Pseudaestuariivita atlantica]|uniref:hypothetical protein n=1 Tax=Pseudaestuariivita atlantica TaxID=1317121 RepID=UPI0009E392B1|nr:hypothetical protein [Pseudaestuariivita atlantica]
MKYDAPHDWILDVLTDLKQYARANGMLTLAEQLDDTRLVASTEIASQGAPVTGGPGDNGSTDRTHSRRLGTSQRA